jgi:2-amino-1-hydroxyethylphosphonate dioxygenase (glycine-forming)
MIDQKSNNRTRINEIFYLLTHKGSGAYFAEPVTQLEHALQAAHHAKINTEDEDVILAALLHDIGHLLEPEDFTQKSETHNHLGHPDHDKMGGDLLKKLGFGNNIINMVENHVQAKRYLVTTDPDYRSRLSEASKQTLLLQGGPMWPQEVEKFESEQHFDEMILIRICDEMAKEPGMPVEGLEYYREMLERHLVRNQENYKYETSH